MPNTVHKNPTQRERVALAPYNFVPLPDKPRVAPPPLPHDRYYTSDPDAPKQPVYSGWFECTLTTETPCFIRGPLAAQDLAAGKEAKNKPDFFSLDGGKTPRIPGSSLRGLFRNLIEIISNARLNFVTDRKLVYRAVDTTRLGQQYRDRIMEPDPGDPKHWFTPRVQAGYIRKGGDGEWYIQPAKKINGTTWCRISHKALSGLRDTLKPWPEKNAEGEGHVKNARLIYVQPGNYEFQEVRGGFIRIRFARALRAASSPAAGLQQAVLIESGRINTKHSEAVIFAPDNAVPESKWLPLRREDSDGNEIALDRDYRDQISEQQRMILGPDGALKNWQPVFYLVENGRLTFFGHTLMMRLPYKKGIMEHVPEPLRAEGKPDVDLAEALFGYTRKGGKQNGKAETIAFAGRLSFTDGVYQGNLSDPFERLIQPKVLSTPKPTTFQHYLCQPKPDDKAQLLNYDDDTAIRGYKQYWHRGAVKIGDVEETDREKLRHVTQYTTIKAVKAGATFTFRVYFDNLRDYELGALAWVLQYAAHPDYRLKLGMAKPHGMGAVKIASSLHLVDRPTRYSALFDGDSWALAAAKSSDTDRYVAAFKQWVVNGDAGRFDAQPHIRELLAMLSWPGPGPDKTRYMEIERKQPDGHKVNEYRERPVLPHPTAVLGKTPVPITGLPAAAPANQPEQAVAAPNAQAQPAAAQASAAPAGGQLPSEWRVGVLTEMRPDLRYGVIREEQTEKMYRFDTRVIQGNMPPKKSRVLFQVQGDGKVIAVKRA
ncbi:MAG: TIGR03986 family CRISPR-associated RAMP protein [Candidatus Brachytrichaceae bacterium NZ_4S206]|jgi:CRISPR-associated protein (TIGR03986 family)